MKSTNKNSPDIEYGNVEVSDDAFTPANVKERITIYIDQDIVNHFRQKAAEHKLKYQTLLNQELRNIVSKNGPMPLADTDFRRLHNALAREVAKVRDEIKEIKEGIRERATEKSVKKKRA